jgi:hypothetical protein
MGQKKPAIPPNGGFYISKLKKPPFGGTDRMKKKGNFTA